MSNECIHTVVYTNYDEHDLLVYELPVFEILTNSLQYHTLTQNQDSVSAISFVITGCSVVLTVDFDPCV